MVSWPLCRGPPALLERIVDYVDLAPKMGTVQGAAHLVEDVRHFSFASRSRKNCCVQNVKPEESYLIRTACRRKLNKKGPRMVGVCRNVVTVQARDAVRFGFPAGTCVLADDSQSDIPSFGIGALRRPQRSG